MKSISLNKPTKVYAKAHSKYDISPITHAPLGDRPYLYHTKSSVNITSENQQTATDILREKSQAVLQASKTRERLSSREGKGFIGLYGSDYSSLKGRNSKISTPSSENKRIKDTGISPLLGVKAYDSQLPTIISKETQNTQRGRKSIGGIFGGLLKDPFEEQNRRVQQMAQWRKILDEQVLQKKLIKAQEQESRRVQELHDEERYRRQQRQLIYTYGNSHRQKQKSMEHAASHKVLKPTYYIDSPQTTSKDYQNHYSVSPQRFSRNESESEIKSNAISGSLPSSTINNYLDSLKQDIFMSRKIFQDHIKVLKHEIEKSSQVHSKTDRRSYIFRRESPVPSRFSLHHPTSDVYDQRNSTQEEHPYSKRTRNSISTKDLRFTPIQENESDLDEIVSIKHKSPGPSVHNSIILRDSIEQRSEISENSRVHFTPKMKKVKSNAFRERDLRERVLSSQAMEELENKWQYQSQISGKAPETHPGTPKTVENNNKATAIQSIEISNTSGTDESIFPTTERGQTLEQTLEKTDLLLQHFRSTSNPVDLKKFDDEEEESSNNRLHIIGKHTSRFVDTKDMEELKYVNEQEIIQEVQEVMAQKEPIVESVVKMAEEEKTEEKPIQSSKQLATQFETILEKEESLQEDTTVKADETPPDYFNNNKREKASDNIEENIANKFEWVTDLTFQPNEEPKAKQRRGIQRSNQVANNKDA